MKLDKRGHQQIYQVVTYYVEVTALLCIIHITERVRCHYENMFHLTSDSRYSPYSVGVMWRMTFVTEDISPFCRTTDTLVSEFGCALDFKAKRILGLNASSLACIFCSGAIPTQHIDCYQW